MFKALYLARSATNKGLFQSSRLKFSSITPKRLDLNGTHRVIPMCFDTNVLTVRGRNYSTENAPEKLNNSDATQSTSGAIPKEYLQALKEMADQQPNNPITQAIYIKELSKLDPKAVLERLKDHKLAINEDILKEQIKAMIKEGQFDKASLSQIMQKLTVVAAAATTSSTPNSDPLKSFAVPPNPNNSGVAASIQPSGTNESPLHVVIAQHWSSKLTGLLSIILTAALIYFVIFRGGGIGDLFNNKNVNVADVTSTTMFSDVIGNEEAKEELGYIIDYLKSPGKYARLNVKLPKGILLVGPPGCGKTLLARAVAGEAGVPFYYASGSEFEEMLVGVGARRIRNLFTKAKETSPCIIFIDEIDAIGGKRDAFDNKTKMTLNQLLVELDGFAQNTGVIVVAATNLPNSLDPALTRPGRFDRQVSVAPPDFKARKEMIKYYLEDREAPDVDVENLARTSHGFSGADIFNMVNTAAIQATKNQMRKITMSQLRLALEDVVMGPARKSLLVSPETKKITAFHESGHAIMALNAKSEIFKATLVPRGLALGMVYFLPKDEHLQTKEEFLNHIDISMAGRVAEEIIFGPNKVTQGASSDFQQATKTAEDMVLKYGMSDKVGHISLDGERLRYLSPETKALIESEVRNILEQSYTRTKYFLQAHKSELSNLANALLEYETLSFDEVKAAVANENIKALKEQRAKEEDQLREKDRQRYRIPVTHPHGTVDLPQPADVLEEPAVVTTLKNQESDQQK